MICDARIGPFMGDTEVTCGEAGEHTMHVGVLRDYAWPGSATQIDWQEDDRRTFHGEWPGRCAAGGWCHLPAGHCGDHLA